MPKINKQYRLIFLAVYVIFACAVVYFFRPLYIWSILIVLLPPSLVNFFWLKESGSRVIIFSILTTLIFAPPVELMARLANAWDVQSTLPRLFGIAPLENLIFAFFNFFWVLSFYEYFSAGDRAGKIGKHFKYLLALYVLLFISVFTLFFIDSAIVSSSYAGLSVLILIIPGVFIFVLRPEIFKKTWLATIFFAAVFFIYEIISLLIGSWWWPGEYLLPLNLAGRVFPLDDVLIWYFISTPVLIGGYEVFVKESPKKLL